VAAQRRRKVKIDDDYSKLDQYAILLHEYYKSLRKAGFTVDNALWLIATKDSYPDWLQDPTIEDIRKHIEDEDEED
jgi:hypothetical protein